MINTSLKATISVLLGILVFSNYGVNSILKQFMILKPKCRETAIIQKFNQVNKNHSMGHERTKMRRLVSISEQDKPSLSGVFNQSTLVVHRSKKKSTFKASFVLKSRVI